MRFRLEVRDSENDNAVLYRRPYARPRYVEAYGRESRWTALPASHPQVLVTLIPYFESPTGLSVAIYGEGTDWGMAPLILPLTRLTM
jgi:hypothetical protein